LAAIVLHVLSRTSDSDLRDGVSRNMGDESSQLDIGRQA
jgi:hypothetical protein